MGALLAGVTLTCFDVGAALWTLGLRWFPAHELAANGALTCGVYVTFAILCGVVPRLLGLVVVRRGRPGPAAEVLLNGPALPAGLFAMLIATAATDASLIFDVHHLRVPSNGVLWMVSCAGHLVAGLYGLLWLRKTVARRPFARFCAWATATALVGVVLVLTIGSLAAEVLVQSGFLRVLWSVYSDIPRTLHSLVEQRRGPCCVLWMSCFFGCGLTVGGLAHACRRAPVPLLSVPLRLVESLTIAVLAMAALSPVVLQLGPRPAPHATLANNVVLITVDALRQDHLSCYGGPVTTPNLDALAGAGVRFTRCYSTSPWTRPSCASMHLGVYPSVHGVGEKGVACEGGRANAMPKRLSTVAEVFSRAGYATQAFVSNTQLHPMFGFARGFDDYCMYEDTTAKRPWLSPEEALVPARLIRRRASRLVRLHFAWRRTSPDEATQRRKWCVLAQADARSTAAAVRWIRGARRPFFLWVHYMSVHEYGGFWHRLGRVPLVESGVDRMRHVASHTTTAGPILAEPFDPRTYGLSMASCLYHWPLPSELDAPLARKLPIEPYLLRYQDNLAYVDALIGGLVASLDAHGLRETTHIVVTADHGEEFRDHGGTWHGRTQYEEVTKVPLIVRSPAISSEKATPDELCSLVNLAPTLLSIAGIAPSSDFAGRSLLPTMGDGGMAPSAVYSEFVDSPATESKALRRGQMKCIWRRDTNKVELYDLAVDPRERRDLAAQSPHWAAELRHELEVWQRQQGEVAKVIRGREPAGVQMSDEVRERLRTLGYAD